ncbi:anthranilate synthase component I, partial [Vibrio parahaemolyticus V-223/04]
YFLAFNTSLGRCCCVLHQKRISIVALMCWLPTQLQP